MSLQLNNVTKVIDGIYIQVYLPTRLEEDAKEKQIQSIETRSEDKEI